MSDDAAPTLAQAPEQLFALAYQELKRLARRERRRAPGADTLDTTALVHETFLKIRQRAEIGERDASYLRALAARAMRQILVDRARRRQAGKRGAGAARVTLEGLEVDAVGNCFDLVQVDRGLTLLEQLDARLARVVELHVFAGLAMAEVAQALGVNERTAFRDWRKARAFLVSQLDPSGD